MSSSVKVQAAIEEHYAAVRVASQVSIASVVSRSEQVKIADLTNLKTQAEAIAWWENLTNIGGERWHSNRLILRTIVHKIGNWGVGTLEDRTRSQISHFQ